ncbi:hypothetical protein DFH07DRAFT_779824 [Mycena maculata]|uniref:Secreted protein n=1 Tax=Mycena maculata TaxID=230809 RepID=A0AAD7I696_9AGAR|nr:hypothetical protein DFH07DRAFT_779824 [Mycena maculata]
MQLLRMFLALHSLASTLVMFGSQMRMIFPVLCLPGMGGAWTRTITLQPDGGCMLQIAVDQSGDSAEGLKQDATVLWCLLLAIIEEHDGFLADLREICYITT